MYVGIKHTLRTVVVGLRKIVPNVLLEGRLTRGGSVELSQNETQVLWL